MRHPVRRGLVTLAALAAALVPLAAAQGGAFPGDNGSIAFTCGADICTINPDGSGRSTLITGGTDPSWSSDESAIAFAAPGAGVSVANEDGTLPIGLGAGATSSQPSYSFSGSKVAFVRAGNVYTILADSTGGEQQLTTTGTAADPAYSPDGTRIAFVDSTGGSGFDIWTIPAGGGPLVHVTTGVGGDERQPTYSPDGTTIVYSSGGELFKVGSAASSSPQDLGVAGTYPAYSPDGTKLAFVNAAGHLSVMSSSGTGAVALTSTADAQPDWEAVDASFGPPRNIAYPGVKLATGDAGPIAGHLLTSSIGSWDGSFPLLYKYQWKRCDAVDTANGPCVDIAGATTSFYTPTAADVDNRLRVQVTASNSLGSAAQNSEVTAVVTAIAPQLRTTPQIVGGNVVDTPLTLEGAVWDGSTPLAMTYSWRRCNPVGDLATCVQIPGATLDTYTPTTADVGFSIRAWITAGNTKGSDTGITNHTFPIVDKEHFAPTASAAPAVAGTAGLGRQLTANVGDYDGDAPSRRASRGSAAMRPVAAVTSSAARRRSSTPRRTPMSATRSASPSPRRTPTARPSCARTRRKRSPGSRRIGPGGTSSAPRTATTSRAAGTTTSSSAAAATTRFPAERATTASSVARATTSSPAARERIASSAVRARTRSTPRTASGTSSTAGRDATAWSPTRSTR